MRCAVVLLTHTGQISKALATQVGLTEATADRYGFERRREGGSGNRRFTIIPHTTVHSLAGGKKFDCKGGRLYQAECSIKGCGWTVLVESDNQRQ